jgi:hypothetical protein
MHLDRSKTTIRGKTYTRVLLRRSFRLNGRVKHQTVANLSRCTPEELEAISLALRHKKDLHALRQAPQSPLHLRQGSSVGAVILLRTLAERLGLVQALGSARAGRLALWQVIARALAPGSRLSAVRLAGTHAACDLLGLEAFDEDDLYANLAWLDQHQARIEQSLFTRLHPEAPRLFLYDVTSSYLEGTHNALGAWGYNRDGKSGKAQIVIGLLCDEAGLPLSIEVFAGNTSDPKTVGRQIQKAAGRFGAREVTFVGDRGMLCGPQVKELGQAGFHYITAITKPQIEALLKQEVLQLELFEQPLAEVVSAQEGVRYILRRNPRRAEELQACRESKQGRLAVQVAEANAYLAAHPRAQVGTAQRRVQERLARWKLEAWVQVQSAGRVLSLQFEAAALEEARRLDGCYVLKTDLSPAQASAQTVHARYKDLALVEENFRTCKTVELEVRPVFVQLETSTRGHVLVVMLAHRLIKELERCWAGEDLTVGEGLRLLDTLCVSEILVGDQVQDQVVPAPSAPARRLLALAQVELPGRVASRGITVSTKKKLVGHRPRRSK